MYLQPGATQVRQGPTVVRGSVSANGQQVAGSGFRVAKTGTFTVTFDAAFPEPPIVVATIFGPKWQPRANAHVTEVTTGHTLIRTGDDPATLAMRLFPTTSLCCVRVGRPSGSGRDRPVECA